MPITFQFGSLDARNRAMLVMPDMEAALEHISSTFNLSDHRLNEDDDEAPTLNEIRALLLNRKQVRLYDMEAWHSGDTVEITCAAG